MFDNSSVFNVEWKYKFQETLSDILYILWEQFSMEDYDDRERKQKKNWLWDFGKNISWDTIPIYK